LKWQFKGVLKLFLRYFLRNGPNWEILHLERSLLAQLSREKEQTSRRSSRKCSYVKAMEESILAVLKVSMGRA